jgi:uncharacterized protein (TIGR02466 family)
LTSSGGPRRERSHRTILGPTMQISMKPRMQVVKNTLLAFATPIQQVRFDDLADFNAEVARRVLAMRENTTGEHYSNLGGWHSDSNFLRDLGEPYASQLAGMFMQGVAAALDALVEIGEVPAMQPLIESWANVNERGDSNSLHIHPGNPWSGVYYVATEQNARGEIYFVDPRVASLMSIHPLNPFNATNPIVIAPEAGTLLVFPSFLYHGVHPYQGATPRISVAFNLM